VSTPYIGYGNDTLDRSLPLECGQMIHCPHCGEAHVVECGENMETGEITDLIMGYYCPKQDKVYLAGVNGKSVMGISADVSGKVEV